MVRRESKFALTRGNQSSLISPPRNSQSLAPRSQPLPECSAASARYRAEQGRSVMQRRRGNLFGNATYQARSSDSLRFATTISLSFASFVASRVGRSYRALRVSHCYAEVCNQAKVVGQQESGRADRPHSKRSQSELRSNFPDRSIANRTSTGNFRINFRRTAPR